MDSLSRAVQDLIASGHTPVRVRWALQQAGRAAARRKFGRIFEPSVIVGHGGEVLYVSTPEDTLVEARTLGRAAAKVFRAMFHHCLECPPARYARGSVVRGVVECMDDGRLRILTPAGLVYLPETEIARGKLSPGDRIQAVALGGNLVSQRNTKLKALPYTMAALA